VRRLGGRIVEGARVTRTGDRVVVLADGRRVSAGAVIHATEGWSGTVSGQGRRVVPVYSLMVATEVIDDARWARIGLAGREVFSDHGHVVIYGQRTDDGRIAFGGRGAPYHWGSAIGPEFDHDEAVFGALRSTLRDLLPQLDGVGFTHAWGGPLGIARDWHPSVTWDPVARTGRAGGYVGDGVAASNLAGRTLADLVLGRQSASRPCRGSGTAHRGGSPSRCAGSASTPDCGWRRLPIARSSRPGGRRGSGGCSTGSPPTDLSPPEGDGSATFGACRRSRTSTAWMPC
jgi:glycine/D-amino acid oxidase-like deaminating enzyme